MNDMKKIHFNIETALKDEGNCQNQKVDCEDCSMGKFIYALKLKDRMDDLCDKEIVYSICKWIKNV